MSGSKRVPDWVPPLVVSMARAMRGYSQEVCDRLLTDQRMQAAWTELGQHEVKTLPADLDDNLRVDHWLGPSAETLSPKDEATVAFFAAVVIETTIGNKPQARKDITEFAGRFADAAKVARIARLDPFVRPIGADTAALETAETIFAQIAADIERRAERHPLVLERMRNNKEYNKTRAIVRSIVKRTSPIFGQVLYGTVATATNVALETETDLDAAKIRDWCVGIGPCQ
jgi:hypothetical protein